jgi:hypothetical protein
MRRGQVKVFWSPPTLSRPRIDVPDDHPHDRLNHDPPKFPEDYVHRTSYRLRKHA